MKILDLLEDTVPELFEPNIKQVDIKRKAYKHDPDNIDPEKYYRYNSNSTIDNTTLFRKKRNSVIGPKLIKVLGSGNFSVAIKKEDSSDVLRIASQPRKDLNDDGWFAYIKNITENKKMQSNPWFPRVYEIKIYKQKLSNNQDEYFYIAKMEKLYLMDELSAEENQYLTEKIFKTSKGTFRYKILQAALDLNFRNYSVKDKKLIEALNIIDQVKKGNPELAKHGNDIGGDNIMFRRTSVGVQPVLLDPIYG